MRTTTQWAAMVLAHLPERPADASAAELELLHTALDLIEERRREATDELDARRAIHAASSLRAWLRREAA